MANNELIDVNLLNDYQVNLGEDLVNDMLALYCQQAQQYLADIEQAAIEQNNDAWHQHCHKLKGATASIGFIQLHQFIKGVEWSEESQAQKLVYLAEMNSKNIAAVKVVKQWLADS